MSCLICGGQPEEFIDFGMMPIANGFVTEVELGTEYYHPLKVGFCPDCKMVQLLDPVPPEKMFHDEYPFLTGTSDGMKRHFGGIAHALAPVLQPGSLVIELGSNDGTLLRYFQRLRNVEVLGVDPSDNVAEIARLGGVPTLTAFFNENVADQIRDEYGLADLVVGANVMCHIQDIHSVLRGVVGLLKPSGLFVFEEPYLGDIINLSAFDQMYDEHIFYFSVHSIQHLLAVHGMTLVKVEPQDTHGGSMRYTCAKTNPIKISKTGYQRWLAQENRAGLTQARGFHSFRVRVERIKEALRQKLAELPDVVGYAATSKSTTLFNYCDIGVDLVACIYDTTPLKWNRYTPGKHIPIMPHSWFADDEAEHVLLLAWNHMAEILHKEQAFRERGGKFVVYVPDVKVM